MRELTIAEAVRELQKTGYYQYTGAKGNESKKLAEALCKSAYTYDIENGVKGAEYGIARDAFGNYIAVQIAQ